MSLPQNTQDFPVPHATWKGTAQKGQSLDDAVREWRPQGTNLEPGKATVSRYALRVIDRATGKAYSANELATFLQDGGLAAASSIAYAKAEVAADELAIPITARYVEKTTGADAEALTLADGAFLGQRLNVRLVTDGGGDGTLTPATPEGFATIVFADAGDFAELEWTSDGWVLIGAGGLTAQPTVTA